jgi:hypothetical protein
VKLSNIENVKKWVAALRSGEYEQHSGTMHAHRYDAHCCLGVAMVMGVGSATDCDYSRVADWLGVSPEEQSAPFYGLEKFVDLNDRDKLSFTEIADYVEKECLE